MTVSLEWARRGNVKWENLPRGGGRGEWESIPGVVGG